uniref:Ig-like domain-containing protein n=1 Tax=Echeneis naucrates TaxID=173247 RepID=A0A665T9Q8_ECHNA
MSHIVFLLLLVLYTAQSQGSNLSVCSGNVSLNCPKEDIGSMDFLSVTWYKHKAGKRYGIIRISKSDGKKQLYDSESGAEFGEKYSLLLPKVTPEDSGTYECAISANIGQQNVNLQIHLTVHECAQTETTTVSIQSNTNKTVFVCQSESEDLPVMWSVGGYMAVGLVKVFLCVIIIWVIHVRSSKRTQQSWQS